MKQLLRSLSFLFFLTNIFGNTPSPTFLQTWISTFPFQGSVLDRSFWQQSSNDFLTKNPQLRWKLISGKGYDKVVSPIDLHSTPIWRTIPFDLQIRFVGTGRIKDIQINFWNQGDAMSHGSTESEKKAFSMIKHFLAECQTNGFTPTEKKQKFSSKIKIKSTEVIFQNCLLEIHAEPHQYVIVTLKPFVQGPILNAVQQKIQSSQQINETKEKEELRETLAQNISKHPNGDIVVESIPMINQGEKGYCVPATCARILQYYGFDTNEHILAELMGTKASGGTSIQSLQVNLKKLTSGLPVYVKEIPFSFSRVERYVSRGYPLIWLIPSHCRLIIGVNPKTKEILYSDSWGTRGIENRMSAKKAEALTLLLALLK